MSTRDRIQEAVVRRDLDAARALCLEAASDAFALLTLARIAVVRGAGAEARDWLRRLLVRDVDAPTVCAAGDLYAMLDRPAAATRCWHRALRQDPSSRAARRKLHDWHLARGEDEAAGRHLEAVLAAHPRDPWARTEQAGRLFAAGRWDEALEMYRGLSSSYGAYACGEILLRRGERAAALEAYARSAARDPEVPWPHYRAAVLASEDPRAALRWLERAPSLRGLEDFRARLCEAAAAREESGGGARPAAEPARLRAEAAAGRAACLRTPALAPLYEERQRALAAGRCRLHVSHGRHGRTRFRLRVVLYTQSAGRDAETRPAVRDVVRELLAFHAREFGPGAGMAAADPVERRGPHDYDFFRNAIAHENFPHMCRELDVPRRRREEVMLIFWRGEGAAAPLARGHGGNGHAVVEVAPADAFMATVAAHELYHSTLALGHTDGDKDVFDAGGIMGRPGSLSRLADTFVHFRQKAQCATFPEVQRLVHRGWRADREGRWDEATALYRQARDRDPLHLWVASRLAQTELHRGRYGEAARLVEDLLRVDDGVEYAAQLAQVRIDQGRLAAAERALEAARGWGSVERTHLVAGLVWFRSWCYARAAVQFRRALALDPGSLLALVHLAGTRHAQGRFAAARRLYERVLARDPLWAEVYDRLAVLCADQGDLREAGRMLRRAGGLKRGETGHLYATARIRCRQGRWDAVPRLMERALEDEPHTLFALLLRGWSHLLVGRPESARADFLACRDTQRLSPRGRVAAAWLAALDAAADPAGLERHWRTCRRLDRRDPRVAPLVHVRAALAERTGRPEAVPELVGRLRALEPGLPRGIPLMER